jgi:O-antigen/teichoic acid export membrane protein
MKSIKNLFIYLIPSLVSAVIPIVTLPIFTRLLTVEDYGVYALSIVFGTFASGMANFGMIIGYERNFFENKESKEEQSTLLFSVLFFVFCAFILVGVITFFLKSRIATLIIGDDHWGDLIFLAYCAVGVSSLKMYYLTYFKNTNNAKQFSWYSIDETLLNVFFSFVFIYFFKLGVAGLVLGQLIGSVIVFLFLTVKFYISFGFQLNLSLLKSTLSISLPLTPRIIFGVIGNQVDKYLIGSMITTGGVGIYSLGQRLANVTFTFMTALQNVFTPQVYKKMFNEGELGGLYIGRYLTPFLYVSAAGGLVLSLFAEELIIFLTPLSYHSATSVVTLLSLLYVTYFFGKQPQLIYAKRTGITSLLSLLTILLNIIINLPFIYFLGFEGAAWGTLVTGIISGSVTFHFSQKYYRIIWEYSKLWIILGSFFIFALTSLAFFKLQVSYEIRLYVKISFLLIFGFIGYKLKIVSRENVLLIKESFIRAKPVN